MQAVVNQYAHAKLDVQGKPTFNSKFQKNDCIFAVEHHVNQLDVVQCPNSRPSKSVSVHVRVVLSLCAHAVLDAHRPLNANLLDAVPHNSQCVGDGK